MNFAVADAGGANAHPFTGTFDQSVDGLQVQVPATLRNVVGMADPMPELRSATADFTNSCHKNTLPTHSRRARLSSTVPLPYIEGQPELLVRERLECFRQRFVASLANAAERGESTHVRLDAKPLQGSAVGVAHVLPGERDENAAR